MIGPHLLTYYLHHLLCHCAHLHIAFTSVVPSCGSHLTCVLLPISHYEINTCYSLQEGVSRLREKPSRRAAVTAAEEGPAAVGTQGEPSWREAEETDTSDEEVKTPSF